MDRNDEAKDVRSLRPEEDVRFIDRDIDAVPDAGVSPDTDFEPRTDISREREVPKREGDILGLGGIVVPKSAGDPVTEYDDESVARRRARSAGSDEPSIPGDAPHGKGATGIDMGSGGTGTDIE